MKRKKSNLARVFDLPLAIGLVLTVIYYAIILQPYFADSLPARYTTHHLVEYVVVAFLLWGLTDVVFRIARFPRELASLRQPWLPASHRREPVSRAASYLAWLQEQPEWVQRSRLGKRYGQVLSELVARESTDDLDDYLRYLADMDYEQTQSNYALLRFQCWVMPMFGFLGTVIHFGTALGGQTAENIGDNLAVVMSEMGTAFNTTTLALLSATLMMFAVFVCERIERGIVQAVDDRVDEELANRFERTEASLRPFLDALALGNQQTLATLQATTETQADYWAVVLERLENRFAAQAEEREARFARLISAFEAAQERQRSEFEPAAERVAACQQELAELAARVAELVSGRGELLSLESKLAENLRLLRETKQIDQALHGLTGAIHLLTARGHESRAA